MTSIAVGTHRQAGARASLPQGLTDAEIREQRCLELTGLSVREASISLGRYMLVNWHSILELDPMLRAAIMPIRHCTPERLRAAWRTLVDRDVNFPGGGAALGVMRWDLLLMKLLVSIVDWQVVLVYARHSDAAAAESVLAKMRAATANVNN